MGRLIDACEVIEKINGAIELLGIASKTSAENEGFQTTIKAYKDVRDAIMQEPTAEPERKTGKWMLFENQRQEDIDNGNYMYTCSNCLRSDIHAKTVKVPYCWFCGAKMED